VDCETWSPEKELVSRETRHFISSIDPDTITDKKLNRLVRDHWQVENCLHLVKDRWWDEDKHYLKQPGLGQAFAVLLNAALSVLSWVRKPGDSMTKAAEDFLHSPGRGLRLLGLHKKRC